MCSLTSVVSKLMEHVICSSIMEHANKYNILYPLQHGFHAHRSCETQLIDLVNDISIICRQDCKPTFVFWTLPKLLTGLAIHTLCINFAGMVSMARYTDGFRTSSVIVRKGLLLRVFHPMLHQWFLESHKGLYLAHAFSCFTLMTLLLACSPLLDCLQMTLCYISLLRMIKMLGHYNMILIYCMSGRLDG